MVARTHPAAGLAVSFERDGEAARVELAANGRQAMLVALHLVAQTGELQVGDTLRVLPDDDPVDTTPIDEAAGGSLPAVSRSSHYS